MEKFWNVQNKTLKLRLTSPCVVIIDPDASSGKLMMEAVAALNSASYEGELILSTTLLLAISMHSFRLASWRFSWFAASILKNSSRRCFFWVKSIEIKHWKSIFAIKRNNLRAPTLRSSPQTLDSKFSTNDQRQPLPCFPCESADLSISCDERNFSSGHRSTCSMEIGLCKKKIKIILRFIYRKN